MINDRQRALLRDLSELGSVLSEYDSLDRVRQAVSENQQRLETVRGDLSAAQAANAEEKALRDKLRGELDEIKEETKRAKQKHEDFLKRSEEDALKAQQKMKEDKRKHTAEMEAAQDELKAVKQRIEQFNLQLTTLHRQIEERRATLARLLES
jgi:chromosome segregation ATPase